MVYVQVALPSAPAGTKVQVIWQGGVHWYSHTDTQISEAEHKPACFDGFSLDTGRPPIGPGTYQATLLINDVTQQTIQFTVQGTQTVATPVPPLSRMGFFTSATQGCNAAARTTFQYPAMVYAQVALPSAPAGTKVQLIWQGGIHRYSHTDAQISEAEHIPACFDGFSLETSRSTIGPGNYQVRLLINDVVQQTIQFTVQGTQTVPTPIPVPESMHFFASATQGCNAAAQTSFRFPAMVYVQVALPTASAGTKVQVIWQGGLHKYSHTDTQISVAEHTPACFDGFSLDPGRTRIGPGVYQATLVINGQVKQTIRFTVLGP